MKKIERGSIIQRYLYENLVENKNSNSNEEKNSHYISSEKYNYIPKKYGSLQMFVDSEGQACDYGSSIFTVDEAHKIMILDFRILNCDRNDENILLVKKKKNIKVEKL